MRNNFCQIISNLDKRFRRCHFLSRALAALLFKWNPLSNFGEWRLLYIKIWTDRPNQTESDQCLDCLPSTSCFIF